jgi:hypothetical protein
MLLDLLYTDPDRFYLGSATFGTYDREWRLDTTVMADQELARARMVGECDIAMRTLLIVATISTDPGPGMPTTTIKYQRLFP